MTPQPDASAARKATWPWLAFFWGLAEATFFFIVPDVFTSRLVLKTTRNGFVACFWCLAGALPGGMLLYYLGHDPHLQGNLAEAMAYLPGINGSLARQAGNGLMEHGLPALFIGVLAGIPYKLYALQAAWAGAGLGPFLLVSAAARLSRFLIVTGLVWLVGSKLMPNLTLATKLRIHAGSWTLFYIIYFCRMGL
jgi:membrane protein YqaA with SNARE-associated domain